MTVFEGILYNVLLVFFKLATISMLYCKIGILTVFVM